MENLGSVKKWIFITSLAATAAATSVTLTGCQTISASKAARTPMLAALPLLKVKSVKSNSKGYSAKVTGENGEAYLVNVNRSIESYVTVSAGDRIKVDGDYTGEAPVKVQAIKIFKIR